MSYDRGIIIEKKKGLVSLIEFDMSSNRKKRLGRYRNSDRALKALEERNEELEQCDCPVTYEAIIVKGFK